MAEPRPVTPKSLLFDLLRVAPGPLPVARLCEVGEVFGLSDNAMRVAVTRLLGRGLLVRDERGLYALAPLTTPRSDWVERWRLGERRMRTWKGAWLGVVLPRGTSRADRKGSVRALTAMGFAEGMPGMYVRPDNLAGDTETARTRATALGLEEDAELMVLRELSSVLEDRWRTTLWPVAEHRAACRACIKALRTSAARLDTLSEPEAVRQSFVSGGRAIRLLAIDPLLPDAIADGDARRTLTEEMLRYDAQGRAIWRRFARGVSRSPAHVGALMEEAV